MINNLFGANCIPPQVAAHTDWYTPQGLILWNNLNLKDAEFVWREPGLDIPRISAALKDPNQAVMIEVTRPNGTKHWMLAEAEDTTSASVFVCADPWSGQQKLSDYYGPISGAAFFKKRTPALP